MRSNWQSRIAAFLLAAILASGTTRAWPHTQGEKARVHFLASSTLSRMTLGLNEDTYLAELQFPKSGKQFLVRMIDAYPHELAPLPRATLQSDAGMAITVRRDVDCDRPFGQILLRTAPGDPLAILPIQLTYQPLLDTMPPPKTMLPCYRALRR